MRKKVAGYQLDRDKNERKALLRALVVSLLREGGIETTLTKAKAIQGKVEKLITRAKKGNIADRRIALRFLTKTDVVSKLFDVIAPVFKKRVGGYTRIIKTKTRRGDRAQLVKMMFAEEIPLEVEKTEKVEKETPGLSEEQKDVRETAPKKVERKIKEKK